MSNQRNGESKTFSHEDINYVQPYLTTQSFPSVTIPSGICPSLNQHGGNFVDKGWQKGTRRNFAYLTH